MLFNNELNNEQMDEFDDEPQDSSVDNGDTTPDFDNESSEDEDSPEEESKIGREDDHSDDNGKSTPTDRIAHIQGEDELEKEVSSPLAIMPQGSALFQLYEQSNHAYANAITAYYEEKDYQQAIEKFKEAIENASQRTVHDLTEEQVNEIVAKSMYWQAEAYVKTQDIPQAIEVFRSLMQKFRGHYLALAAQRRADELNTKNA